MTAACLLLALACAPAVSAAQQPATSPVPTPAAPSFDVATIKPHQPDARVSWMGIMDAPDGVNAVSATLQGFIRYAYHLPVSGKVTGGPAWAASETYDLQARMGEADLAQLKSLSPAQATDLRRQMMQTLLAERFHLKVHTETKQVPVLNLVIAKGGPKLQDAATDTSPTLRKDKDGNPFTGIFFQKDLSTAQGETMQGLANLLSSPMAGLGRPVVDKTGLTGAYDFTLNWSVQPAHMENGVGAYSTPPDDAPTIFSALAEIGLKLQPATGTIDTIVIDHADKPTDN